MTHHRRRPDTVQHNDFQSRSLLSSSDFNWRVWRNGRALDWYSRDIRLESSPSSELSRLKKVSSVSTSENSGIIQEHLQTWTHNRVDQYRETGKGKEVNTNDETEMDSRKLMKKRREKEMMQEEEENDDKVLKSTLPLCGWSIFGKFSGDRIILTRYNKHFASSPCL